MNQPFKFAIGAIVFLKQDFYAQPEMVFGPARNKHTLPTGRLIVERHMLEWHGGEQRLYSVRMYGYTREATIMGFVQYAEVELINELEAAALLAELNAKDAA